MIQPWIEVHMTTELVHWLPGVCGRVGMEARLAAVLYKLQATRCGQSEDSTALGGIARSHDNRNGLFHHNLHHPGPMLITELSE